MMKFLYLLIGVLAINVCNSQTSQDHILWHESRKLTINDFAIKNSLTAGSGSFAQFSMNYQLKGFDVFTKNFNKKVENRMIGSASWLDTTSNVSQALLYQQTLFDLSEIYTRKFRKALKEERKRLIKNLKLAEDLNDNIMTEFSKRRLEYSQDTNFGLDSTRQMLWQNSIKSELSDLAQFAYDK